MLEGIHKRLKLAREVAGYKTAKQFAKKFDIPLSTYSNHENDKRTISLEIAKRYADFLKIDLCWLLTGNNHKNSYVNKNNTDEKYLTQVDIEELTEVQERAGFKRTYIDLSISPDLLAEIIEILNNKNAQLTPQLNHKEYAFIIATIYQEAIKNCDLLSSNKRGFLSHSCHLMIHSLRQLKKINEPQES